VHALGRPSLRRAVPRGAEEAALRSRVRRTSLQLVAVGLAILPGIAPAAEREARLAFLGDGGTGGDDQKAVRDQLLAQTPSLSFVFLLGDNIYTSGSAEHIKDRFDDVYAPVMSRGARFHAALGNHDVRRCPAAASDPLPADASAYRTGEPGCDVEVQLGHSGFGYVGGRRYYTVSSDEGPVPLVQVFALDSNTLRIKGGKLGSGREDVAQIAWLEAALAASSARWKIVMLHHPPESPRGSGYLGFVHHERERGVGAQLERILKRYGVDVVFAGHNHFYARMAPRDGVRYFVSGGGGRRLYGMSQSAGYLAAGGEFFHFVYVRASESRFEYYAIDSKGNSRDAGWFAKGDATDTPLPPGTLPPR
jgi:acid phosphatase